MATIIQMFNHRTKRTIDRLFRLVTPNLYLIKTQITSNKPENIKKAIWQCLIKMMTGEFQTILDMISFISSKCQKLASLERMAETIINLTLMIK